MHLLSSYADTELGAQSLVCSRERRASICSRNEEMQCVGSPAHLPTQPFDPAVQPRVQQLSLSHQHGLAK